MSLSTPPATVPGLVGRVAAYLGAVLFLAGTLLHPARDGAGVAGAGHLYGLTHAAQAIGLLFIGVAVANLVLGGRDPAVRPVAGNMALIGTLWWLALIVYDGAHNPATARYAPEVVHTAASLDPGAGLLVAPALVLFPVGYLWLGSAVRRSGRVWSGLLLGGGALVYTLGGVLLFPLGPDSAWIQPLESVGAGACAAGLVLLANRHR